MCIVHGYINYRCFLYFYCWKYKVVPPPGRTPPEDCVPDSELASGSFPCVVSRVRGAVSILLGRSCLCNMGIDEQAEESFLPYSRADVSL